MNGLINRCIQCFLRDGWGDAVWQGVAQAASAPARGFEPLMDYAPELTERLLAAAVVRLDRERNCLLEDMGTYIVSHPKRAAIRRLLRFGGNDFREFLRSLEDLPARARLAWPDLILPGFCVEELAGSGFRLEIAAGLPGSGAVALGLLRAMADDYGALVVLETGSEQPDGGAVVFVRLLDDAHAERRAFELGAGA